MPITVLLVGPLDRDDFLPVAQAVEGRPGVFRTQIGGAVGHDATRPRLGFDLIVLLQAYPYAFSAQDVAHWRTAAPDSRIWAVLGSWCEGETRTGTPLPDCERIRADQFPARLATLDVPDTAAMTGPASDSTDMQRPTASFRRNDDQPPLVVVVGSRIASCQATADLLHEFGCRCIAVHCEEHTRVSSPVAALIYEDSGAEQARRELPRLQRQFPADVHVALVDFPRHQEIRRFATAGFHVLGKPLVVDDLLSLLTPPD